METAGVGARIALFFIRLYRRYLSGVLGVLFHSSCRFFPTCSEYSSDAIKRYGLRGGLALTAKRLVRCHPWCEGGWDPVPDHIRPNGRERA